MFRTTVLDFFSSVHDFEPNVLGLGWIFLIFVFENASTSPQDLLKKCFFLEKPHTCLSFSNFERKFSVNLLRCFSRTVRIVFYVSKWTLRMKNFFIKNFFLIVFWTPTRKRAVSSVSFRQLWQNCNYVSIGMFWGKQMISERDVFFREFSWKILDLRWSFSAGLSKQHSKCPEENFERVIIGKIFQVNFTFRESSAVGFSELNLECRAFYCEKNCLLIRKLKTLLLNFGFGAKKICHNSKRHRKDPFNTALNCPD